MNILHNQLNKDQLSGLSNLCFDLAKGAFALALVPAINIASYSFGLVIQALLDLALGIAFTYLALVFLKRKETTQR